MAEAISDNPVLNRNESLLIFQWKPGETWGRKPGDGNLGRKPWGQTGRSLVFFDQYGNAGRIAARNERCRVTDLIIF